MIGSGPDPQGGVDYRGIGIVEVVWKVVTSYLPSQIQHL